MKAKITTPSIPEGTRQNICIRIPFDKIELSISLDNNCDGKSEWLTRNDFRVYDKKTSEDLTEKVLGESSVHADSGIRIAIIIMKVADYDYHYATRKYLEDH